MDAEPHVPAISALSLTVFRLNGMLLHLGDRLVEPLELTSARWQMLGALALSESRLTAPQVGRVMGVTRQGALKQLGILQGLGLVQSYPNPGHARSPHFSLTPRGRKLYQQADALWNERVARLESEVPSEKLRKANQVLERLERALEAVFSDLEVRQ